VEDDGTVTIAGNDEESAQAAARKVEALTESVQVGKIYDGRVTSIKDFGAFVEILPGKDGLCHISELSEDYVSNVADVCNVGDRMHVKVIAVDEQDRVKLSRRVAMQELAEQSGKGNGEP
jgi:polyribonucleotide nucleotidyltransferase